MPNWSAAIVVLEGKGGISLQPVELPDFKDSTRDHAERNLGEGKVLVVSGAITGKMSAPIYLSYSDKDILDVLADELSKQEAKVSMPHKRELKHKIEGLQLKQSKADIGKLIQTVDEVVQQVLDREEEDIPNSMQDQELTDVLDRVEAAEESDRAVPKCKVNAFKVQFIELYSGMGGTATVEPVVQPEYDPELLGKGTTKVVRDLVVSGLKTLKEFRIILCPAAAVFLMLVTAGEFTYDEIGQAPMYDGTNDFGEPERDPEAGPMKFFIQSVQAMFGQGLSTSAEVTEFRQGNAFKGLVYYVKMALMRLMPFAEEGRPMSAKAVEYLWPEIQTLLRAAAVYAWELWYQELQRVSPTRQISRMQALKSFSTGKEVMNQLQEWYHFHATVVSKSSGNVEYYTDLLGGSRYRLDEVVRSKTGEQLASPVVRFEPLLAKAHQALSFKPPTFGLKRSSGEDGISHSLQGLSSKRIEKKPSKVPEGRSERIYKKAVYDALAMKASTIEAVSGYDGFFRVAPASWAAMTHATRKECNEQRKQKTMELNLPSKVIVVK